MSEPVIRVEDLHKSYGTVEALRGVSFEVHAGEVFGLLGPNGAGKTSTIEILEGLRAQDRGNVSVAGLDPQTAGPQFKQQVGAVLQSTALPEKLRVGEALSLFANFYRRHHDTEALLKRFQLEEKRNAFYSQLSGGQKQRLALALALVNDPVVVFLDEPTAGLDPRSRQTMWDIAANLVADGVTIFLTTQYLEEADRLADRVAVLDHGRIVGEGTPEQLKARVGSEVLVARDGAGDPVREIPTDGTPAGLRRALDQLGNEKVSSVGLRTPSLDDVFFALTGPATPAAAGTNPKEV